MKLAGRSHFSRNWKKLTGDKKNFGKCAGLQNLISRGSNPGQGSSQLKNEYRSICFRESRNRKHVAERCHSESVTCFRRDFKQPVSGRQIRWRKEVSDKPEKSKFVYTIPAFQSGWLPSNKRSLVGGGLHVQDRSSRCILYNTDNSKVQEIPQVQMGGNPVRVSLSLLRTRPSTSEIYKINEGPYCSTAAPKHLPKNIPGRHADNGQVSTGIDLSSRHCDLPSAESRICTEFKEVSSGTISENRIFGNGYRLSKDGNLIASGEVCKTNATKQASSREQRDYYHEPNKVNRETRINCPSNTASTTSSSILAAFGTEGSHHYTRAEGSAFSHIDFYKIQNSSEDACPDGQQSSLELPGKDGGTRKKDLLGLSKQIWDYLQSKKITITAMYLPGHLNKTGDWECRNFQDKSDWKLSQEVLAKICQKLGTPSIDIFASRMSHQLPVYMAWKPDPGSQESNAMYQPWSKMFPHAFPPFSLIPRVLSRLRKEGIIVILVAPTWQSQAWYSVLLSMYQQSTFIATSERPTSGHIRKNSSFSSKPNSKTDGLVGFWKSLALKGISYKACKTYIRFQKRKFNLFLRIGVAPVGCLVW